MTDQRSETVRLAAVDPLELPDHIDILSDYIIKACDHSRGEVTDATLVDALYTGEMQLWIVYDEAIPTFEQGRVRGIVVTRIGEATSGINIGEVALLGGESIAEWVHLVTVLEDWAADNGCAKIQAIIRKGLAKYLPEWKVQTYVIEKDLRNHGQEVVRN